MERAKVHVNCAPGPRPKQKLLERAQDISRRTHYSIRTERAYLKASTVRRDEDHATEAERLERERTFERRSVKRLRALVTARA